jgi:hypothetical protein
MVWIFKLGYIFKKHLVMYNLLMIFLFELIPVEPVSNGLGYMTKSMTSLIL